MVISVSEKVHSGGHGEGGSESNKGEQGIAQCGEGRGVQTKEAIV